MRPTPDRRLVLRAAGAVALLGLGTACARIPVDSPVASREVGGGTQPGAPYVRALPPAEDASPEEIVIGFIHAGVGLEDDYAVAREYLTGDALESWDPDGGVTVYSSSQDLQVDAADEETYVLVVEAIATMDATGARQLLSSPAGRETFFALTEVDGQWRISSAPDGIFLSEAAFETLYAPARIYFLDSRQVHLVPDQRWVSLQRGSDAVLSLLIDGPAPHLRDAVTSAVPGTLDPMDAVVSTREDGSLQVTVPAAIRDLPSPRRRLAVSQIEASLRSLRTLSGIRALAGEEIPVDGESQGLERELPGHRPIAAGELGVIALTEAETDPESAQLVPELAGIQLRRPTLARNGVHVAALSADESVVLLAATDASVPLREAASGGVFVGPRIDDAGYVWTSARSSAGVLLALAIAGPEQDVQVDAAWLAGRQILSLDLAPDATRLLVLSSDAGGARLDLCAIRRDPDGIPMSLTEPLALRTFVSHTVQAGWYDEMAVIVLGEDPSAGEPRALVVDLAGERDPLPEFTHEVVSVAGTVVAETVWAGTADGQLLRSDGESWSTTSIIGRDPAFY